MFIKPILSDTLHSLTSTLTSTPTKSLRNSIEDFKGPGWHPVSQKTFDKWMEDIKPKITPLVLKMPGPGEIPFDFDLLGPLWELKELIETDTEVHTGFVRMFDGVTESPKSYWEMLLMLNEIFRQPPQFGSIEPSMYMTMTRFMNTHGGFSASARAKLNSHFEKMLKTWEHLLVSPKSCTVLNTDVGGWFSPPALDAMMQGYPGRRFEDVFICSPEEPHFGFVSLSGFFVRPYRNPTIDRPTGSIDNPRVISSPCESSRFVIQEGVQKLDALIIKGEAYSLMHLLAGDESVDSFCGGTVIQTFLNVTDYHRWHAPVNGTIAKIVNVPGTYFAQAPDLIGNTTQDNDQELPPNLNSFAKSAARRLIFINADNPAIGLMCFIAIGMTEMSTCEATVSEGQYVVRGDELGMFHFGGSSSALVFNAKAGIKVSHEYTKLGVPVPINAPFAVAAAPEDYHE